MSCLNFQYDEYDLITFLHLLLSESAAFTAYKFLLISHLCVLLLDALATCSFAFKIQTLLEISPFSSCLMLTFSFRCASLSKWGYSSKLGWCLRSCHRLLGEGKGNKSSWQISVWCTMAATNLLMLCSTLTAPCLRIDWNLRHLLVWRVNMHNKYMYCISSLNFVSLLAFQVCKLVHWIVPFSVNGPLSLWTLDSIIRAWIIGIFSSESYPMIFLNVVYNNMTFCPVVSPRVLSIVAFMYHPAWDCMTQIMLILTTDNT